MEVKKNPEFEPDECLKNPEPSLYIVKTITIYKKAFILQKFAFYHYNNKKSFHPTVKRMIKIV